MSKPKHGFKLLIVLTSICAMVFSIPLWTVNAQPGVTAPNKTHTPRHQKPTETTQPPNSHTLSTNTESPPHSPTSTSTPSATQIVTTSPTLIKTSTITPTLPTPTPTATGLVSDNGPVSPVLNAFYVSPDGNDANPGTASSPFKTVAKGLSMLTPGNTLYLKSGVYLQTASLIISRSGTQSSHINISTAPGESSPAVISGDTNGNGNTDPSDTPASVYSGLLKITGSYIDVSNIEVGFSGGRGVMVGGTHVTLSRINVHHAWNSGIYVYGPDNSITQSAVWRNAESNWCGGVMGRQCNGNWPGGLAWGATQSGSADVPGAAPRLVLRGNRVYNNSGEGVICMHTDNATIEGNIIYDNWALNIDLDRCSNTTISSNLIYYTNTGDTTWWRSSTRPGTGIMLSNECTHNTSGNSYPIGHDRRIFDNIIAGSGSNFYFWKGDCYSDSTDIDYAIQVGYLQKSVLSNDLLANNTFIEAQGSGQTGIKIDPPYNASLTKHSAQIYNNIVIQNSGYITYGTPTGVQFANNLWSRPPGTAFQSIKDVIGNAALVDPLHQRQPGAVQSSWFKESASSLSIDKAIPLSSVLTDFFGLLRGFSPDIGAAEYQ